MKRAIPVLLLSVGGLVPVWLYEPGAHGGEISEVVAPETPQRQTRTQAPTKAPAPTLTRQRQQQARTVNGPAVNTSEGTVQVRVAFQGTKITDVKAVRAPNSQPTRMALPILREETLKAQRARTSTRCPARPPLPRDASSLCKPRSTERSRNAGLAARRVHHGTADLGGPA